MSILTKDGMLLEPDDNETAGIHKVIDMYSRIKNHEHIEIVCYNDKHNSLVARDITELRKSDKVSLLKITFEDFSVLVNPKSEIKTEDGFLQARYLTPYTKVKNVIKNTYMSILDIKACITGQVFELSVNGDNCYPIMNNIVIR